LYNLQFSDLQFFHFNKMAHSCNHTVYHRIFLALGAAVDFAQLQAAECGCLSVLPIWLRTCVIFTFAIFFYLRN